MSINLDNVKAIVHNNKNVKKIEDSHGIIWQAPSSGEWHTIWEGTKSKNASGTSDSGYTSNTNIVNPGLTGTHQVRLYFSSISASASNSFGTHSVTYYSGGTNLGTTKPTSPVEVTLDFDSTKTGYSWGVGATGTTVGTGSYAGASTARQVYVTYNPTNGFRLTAYYRTRSGGVGSVSASMTLTKIEVYY